MCMCRAYPEDGDPCMDAAHFRRAETAAMGAPCSVSVCADPEIPCCLAGEDDARIVVEYEVSETARRCSLMYLRCHSLQIYSARLRVTAH